MSRLRRALSHTNPSAVTAAAPIPETVTVESDLVVILAALLCALICVVGLIAVARCAWLRRSSSGSSGYSAQAASANKGLKKKILRSLPKFTYTSGNISGPKFALECVICLAEFAEGDELRVLPQCGHGFHVACIDTWLGSHSSCPSCRQILAVTRCNKCGEFPAISGGGAGREAELKCGEETSSTNSTSSSNGFLP